MKKKIENREQIADLLEFNDSLYYQQAITFKQYQQEFNSRNKDIQLKHEINENLFEFGQQVIEFFYYEFLAFQNLPKKDDKSFSSFSRIYQIKQELINDSNLAEIAIQLGLKDKIRVSVNNNPPLINNPKILAQALKAIIGAHYFDKNKDINKLKKVIHPIYQILLKKYSNEQFSIQPIQSNPKGEFQEYIQKNPEVQYKVIQEIKNFGIGTEQQKTIHIFQLQTNILKPIEKQGEQKKEVEKQLYIEAIQQLKKLNNNSSHSIIDQSEISSQVHNNLREYGKLEDIDQVLAQISNLNQFKKPKQQ